LSVSGDLTVSGNLTISGNTTTINTETLTVEDNIIILNSSATGSPTLNAGIEVERGDNTNVVLRWNETEDTWQVSDTSGSYGNVAVLGSIQMNDIANVSVSGMEVGHVFIYGDNAWMNESASVFAARFNFDNIGDVEVGSANSGDILQYQAGQSNTWVSVSPSNAFNELDSLTITNNLTVNGVLTVSEIAETTLDANISSNTLTASYTTTNIFYVDAPSANFTVNVTNVPTANNRMMTVSVVVSQGATGYIPSALQIDGNAQTIKWSGGSAPGATNNKIDIFSFNLFRRSNTWTVFGAVSANY
jgi:hypothetical protein